MSTSNPKVTFGMIVLNAEPFLRPLLRTVYPYAHEIIVVEGACPGAVATEDGHSVDGTLDVLGRFCRDEDPDNKVQVITRNGFWSEKTEESIAFAERATGDYLWVCAADEFNHPRDIERVLDFLRTNPTVDMVSLPWVDFWGDFDYVVDGWDLHRGWRRTGLPRIFRWGPGYRYVEHRPDTVCDPSGRDLRSGVWVTGRTLAQLGVCTLHYTLVFPQQVSRKLAYYSKVDWADLSYSERWAAEHWFALRHPFDVHREGQLPSWLHRFHGEHPPEIVELIGDLADGKLDIPMRQTADIEALLATWWYPRARAALRAIGPSYLRCQPVVAEIRGHAALKSRARRLVSAASGLLKR